MTTRRLTFQTLVKYGLAALLVVAFVLYVAYQARFLLQGPVITLDVMEPTVQNERVASISGQAENITHITLNGRQIYTDKAGHFKETLILENGYTIFTVTGIDRYGRHKSVSQSIWYQPPASEVVQDDNEIININ